MPIYTNNLTGSRKYHRQRAQDTLGGLTPIEFEAKLTEPLTLAA